MKKILKIAVFSTVLAVGFVARAAGPTPVPFFTDAVSGFSSSATNEGAALAHVIVGNRSSNDGAPYVTFIASGSDVANASLRFYKVIAQVQAAYATNATTTISVVSTNSPGIGQHPNGTWNSGTCIIRHYLDDTYEKRTLTTATGSTNIVTTVAPSTTVPGDTIYLVVTNALVTLSVPAYTNTVQGSASSPLYVGQKDKPLLIDINGTSGTRLTVSGVYQN